MDMCLPYFTSDDLKKIDEIRISSYCEKIEPISVGIDKDYNIYRDD